MDDLTNTILNKLCKWRTVLTGRILGTRSKDDPQAKGYRDIFESQLLMRAELNAFGRILIEKGICTQDEFSKVLREEAAELDKAYERTFPGFRTTTDGITIDAFVAKETTRNWPA